MKVEEEEEAEVVVDEVLDEDYKISKQRKTSNNRSGYPSRMLALLIPATVIQCRLGKK